MEESQLNIQEQQFLLQLARKSLVTYLTKNETYKLSPTQIPKNLQNKQSCFVTYKKKGALRGCIGSLCPSMPLFEEVIHKAVQAAIYDRRFSPITKEELADIHIDITVLSPPHPITNIEQFVIGKHGIMLEKGNHSAVYLPQVAPEQGWNREQTLCHLATKAGLKKDGWASASFKIFTAQIIEEPLC